MSMQDTIREMQAERKTDAQRPKAQHTPRCFTSQWDAEDVQALIDRAVQRGQVEPLTAIVMHDVKTFNADENGYRVVVTAADGFELSVTKGFATTRAFALWFEDERAKADAKAEKQAAKVATLKKVLDALATLQWVNDRAGYMVTSADLETFASEMAANGLAPIAAAEKVWHS